MKKNYINLILSILLISIGAFAQSISRNVVSSAGGTLISANNQISYTIGETFASTLTANDKQITQGFGQPTEQIITGAVSTSICAGSNVIVPFSAIGMGSGNAFTAQLSDGSGSFALPISIGTLVGSTSGSIIATIPINSPFGSAYRIRVVSSVPLVIGSDNGSDITITPNTTNQSTAVFYTKASGDFSNPSIWEYQDSCGNWVEATLPPWIQNTCVIRSLSHSDVFIPQQIKSLVIQTGASLTIVSELTVAGGGGGGSGGGTGSSIEISGILTIPVTGYLTDSSGEPVSIQSGGSIVSSGEIHLSGDMTIDGQFSGAIGSDGKLYLFGGNTQTITANSNNNNLGDVFIDKTLLSSEVRIHNNALLTTLDIPLLQMSKGTVKFFNETKGFGFIKAESSAEAKIVAGTADLFVHGDMTIHGQFDGADCKLTFDSTSPQVITYDPPVPSPISNFGDVSFSNTSAAGLLLTGAPTAFFLTKKGYDYYKMQSNMACKFLESFTIGAGATMEVTGATAMSVGGAWTNNGTFIPGTGTVIFDGSGTSKIGGSTSPQNFYNLEVNKDSELDIVDLDCDDLDVANDLTFTKGRSRKGLNAVNVRIVNRLSILPSGIFDGSLDVSVGGDMRITHGQFEKTKGHRLTFNGTSAQVLDYSPAPGSQENNFGELVFDNPSTVQVIGTEDIITEKTHTKTGHVTLLKRTAATESFRIDAGAIVTTGASVEVAVGGDMTVHGQYDGALGKLTFDGSSAQVLDHSPVVGSPPSNFGELVFDNPSTVQVSGTQDIDVLKKHTKTGHVTLLKRTAATESFRIDAGAIVTTGASVEVAVGGEMTVHGQYDGALGKLTFDGSSAQVLDHSPVVGSPPSNFGELVFDNPSTVQVSGTQDIDVLKKHTKTGHVTLLKRTAATESFRIDSGGIVTTGPLVEVSVGGDMTVYGQYDGALGKLSFDGTSAQVLDHSPAPGLPLSNFGEVVYENPSLAGVTVQGNDVPFVSEKKEFKGHVTLLKRTAARQNAVIDASGDVIFGDYIAFSVGGDWINNGGTFDPGTSTVIFDGAGTSHIGGTASAETFYDIKTSCFDLLNDKSTLNVQNLKIVVGKFTGGPGTVTLQRNMIIDEGGLFDPNLGTVVFDGTVEQELTGLTNTGPRDILFHNLTVNNGSDYRIDTFTCCGVGSGRVTVTGDLELIAGKIKLNCDLVIDTNATITGASPTRYIKTEGKGTLLQLNSISNNIVNYPIGTETGYNPVTYQLFSTTGQPVVLGARVADGVSTAYDTNENPIGTAIVDRAVLKTFFVTGTIPAGDHITIQPQWNAADEGLDFDRTACDLAHYTGGQWVRSTPTAAVATNPPGTYTGSFDVTVTSLSPFAVFSQSSTSCSTVGEWTGAVSSAWSNPNNWCNGMLPTATTNVVIPSGTSHQPTIAAGAVAGIVVGAIIATLTINSGATLTVSDNLELHLSGDMTVHGQYNGFDGKLVFDGASAQVFDHSPNPASPPSNFGELKFSNTAGGVTVIGNTIPIVAREASAPSISEIVVTKHMDLSTTVFIGSGAKFTVTATGELSVGGDMTVHGQYSGVDGKLTFDGSSAQVFDHSPDPASPPSNFGELVFSNTAGGITVIGNTIPIVAREASAPSISEIVVTKQMDIATTVLFSSSSKFTVTATGELSVGGNMTVHGQYNGVSGKLTFDGASAQVLDYSPDPSSPPSNFGEVICNNALGVDFTGNHDITAYRLKGHLGTVSILRRTAVQNSVVIDPGAILHVPVSSELAVGGDMTVHGQYNGVDGKLTFDGASAQVFDHSPNPASPPSNFGKLVFSNTAGGITVIGNTIPIVAREASAPSVSEVVVTKHMDIATTVLIFSGAKLTVTATGELSVGGDMTVHGQYNGVDGKLTFDGTAPQVITYDPPVPSPLSNFGDVSFSNNSAAGILITGPTTAFWLSKKGYDYYQAKTNMAMRFQESFTIGTGASMEVTSATAISVGGDWTNNGTFIPGTGTVSFNRSGTSKIGGTTSPQNFYNLEINKDSDLDRVDLDCDDLNVANDLTVTKGSVKKGLNAVNVSIIKRLSISPSGIFDGNLLDVSVGGDMTVHGQYNGVDGTLTFDGTSAQAFDHSPDPTSPPSNFGELVFSNTAGGITVIGNTIPIVAREASAPSISEIVVTKAMDISGPVLINTGAQFTVTATGELSVGGDMTVHGQYNGVDGKLTFDGTSAQVITYDPSVSSTLSNFGDVSFSNTSVAGIELTSALIIAFFTKKAYATYELKTSIPMVVQESFTIGTGATMEVIGARDITVGGDWINNGGTFIPGAGAVIFNGSGNSIIGGASSTQDFNNLTVNKSDGTSNVIYECFICHARTITIQSGNLDAGTATDIFVSGDWINNGGAFNPGTSTVIFNGIGTSHIGGTSLTETFYDLQTSCFDLINDKTTLNVQNLKIVGGKFTGGPGTITLQRNMTIDEGGLFEPNLGTVVFNGNVEQELNGLTSTGPRDIVFHNIIVNNSADFKIDTYTCCGINPRPHGVTVTGDIELIAGKIKLNYNLFIASSAEIIGASPDRYIIINGQSSVQHVVPVNDPPLSYPIGTVLGYSPVTFDLGTVTAPGTIQTKAESLNTSQLQSLGISTSNHVSTKFIIEDDESLAFNSCAITFNWEPSLATGNPALYQVKSKAPGSSTWLSPHVVSRTATSITIDGVSSFGEFVIGESDCSTVGEWTGAVSSAWSNPNNWCSGILPTATTNVVIPSGTPHSPVAGIAGGVVAAIVIAKLTIDNGASLTVNDNLELHLSGDMIVHGQYNGFNGKLVFDGASAQVFDHSPDATSPPSNFGKLVFSNTAGGITVIGNTIPIVAREASAPSVSEIVITKQMDIATTVLIFNGAKLTVTATGELFVGGDLTVHGQYNGVDGKLSFDGASAQVFDFSPDPASPPSNFGELVFNNTAGGITVIGNAIPILAREASAPSISEISVSKKMDMSSAVLFSSSSKFTVTATGELSVGGDLTVHGQYNGVDGKLTFDGSSAQVFDFSPDPASPPSNFGELVFNNTAGGITVIGNTIPILAREASAPSISEISVSKKMDMSSTVLFGSSSKFTVTATGELSVGGDLTVHGQYNGVDGKLTFDGSSAQVFDFSPDATSPPSNFGELVFSNTAGGVTVIGNTIPIVAREASAPSISEIVVTKQMDIATTVLMSDGAKLTVTATGELSVGGDMTVHGQYDGALGKLTFDGSSAQVLDHSPVVGSPPSNFGEVVFDNPSLAGVTVQGNDVPFVSEKKEFKGHVTLLKRSDARQSVVIDALGDVILGDSIEFSVGGDWTNNGGAFDPGTSTVIFNGSENSIIGGTSSTQYFNDLKVNKSSGTASVLYECAICHARTITIQSGNLDAGTATDIFVSGDWINNGGTFIPGTSSVSFFGGDGDSHIGGTAVSQDFHKVMVRESPTLASTGQTKRTVCSGSTTSLHVHDIEISSFASFDSGTASLIEISGDWTNNGSFVPNTGEVKFSCDLAVCDSSNIRGTSTNFSKLTVFKPSGVVIRASVSFPSLTTVSGELKFTNGKIFLVGVGDVVINEDAIITGASSEKYIVSSCTHVYHPSNPSRLFPIGTTLGYSPVSIDLGGITTQGSLKTKANNLDSSQLSSIGISEIGHVSTLFTVEKDASLAFSSCAMTFSWDASLATGNPALYQVKSKAPGTSTWLSPHVVSRTATSITIDGVNSFGEFVIGESDCSTVGEWTGAVSSAWSNPNNWCSGTLPTPTTNVVIPSGTPHSPVIGGITGGVIAGRIIAALRIDSGASLTVSDNLELSISGDITVHGQYNGLDGKLTFNGSSAQVFDHSPNPASPPSNFGALKFSNTSGGVSVRGNAGPIAAREASAPSISEIVITKQIDIATTVLMSDGAKLTVTATGELSVGGDMTVHGQYNGVDGKLSFNGSLPQTFDYSPSVSSPPSNFGDVSFNNPTDVSVTGAAGSTTTMAKHKNYVGHVTLIKGRVAVQQSCSVIGGIVTVPAGTELSVSGAMTVHGQFDGAEGKLTFDGASAQVFDHSPNPASPPSNFGALKFSNTAGGVTVIGNAIPIVAREASAPSISEIVITKQIDIATTVLMSDGAKLTVTATGELSVGGDMTVHGQYNGVDGKLSFNGSLPQTFDYSPSVSSPPSNFGDVSFNNPTDVSVTGAAGSTTTMAKHKNYVGHVTLIKGRVAVQQSCSVIGGILTVPAGTELSVSGDITVSGQYDGSNGTLTCNGTSAQVLSNDPSSVLSNYGDVIFDNPSTVAVTNDFTVKRIHTKTGHVTISKRTIAPGNVTVDNGSIMTVPVTGELHLGGILSVAGQFDGQEGKLSFEGSLPQTFDYSPSVSSPPSNFGEVSFDNPTDVSVTGAAGSTTTMAKHKNYVGHVTLIKGRVAVQQSCSVIGGILTVPAGTELSVGGDMTVHGQFDGIEGKLSFNGSIPQTFDFSPSVSSPPSNFGEVSFDNPTDVSVTGAAGSTTTMSQCKEYVGHVTLIKGRVAVQQSCSIIGGILTVPASTELSVSGDMTVHGQFDGVDGKLTLNGTSAQVLTYDPPVPSTQSNFGDVSFSNTSVAGIVLTSTTSALWLSKKGYEYYKMKSNMSMSFQESFTIGTGATMEVLGATDITVGGDWINNGGTFIPGAGTVIFNGSGNSIIGGTSSSQDFNNLTVNKSGGTSLSVWTFPVCHARTITIQSGNLDAGSATAIFVSGNWRNNGGAFIPGTITVIFDGTAVQKIEGVSTSFHKLTVDNAAGLEIRESPSFPKLTTVSGDLKLTNGKIYLYGGQDLQLVSNATITGTSPTRYIVTNGKGSLKRQLLTIVGGPNTQMVYPIGTQTGYNPVTYQLFSVTGQPLVLGARVADGVSTAYDANENPTGSAIVSRAVLKTFFATGNIPAGDYIKMKLQWNGADEGVSFNRSSCNLGHYTGGQWVYSEATAAVAGEPGNYSGSFSATCSNLSPFAVFSQSITNSFTGTTFCAGQDIPITYTVTGGVLNAGNAIELELSDVAGNFPGTIFRTLPEITLRGTMNGRIPLATPSGSNYRIRVNSTNPAILGIDNGTNLTIASAAASAGSNGVLTVCAGTIPTPAQLFAALTGSPASGGVWTGPVLGVYTYTQSGSSSSCPSNSATVTVTNTPNTTFGSTTVTSNSPYTWPLPDGTGLNYATSGVYTNTTGCNVATLNLIITVNTFTLGSNCGATISGLNVTINTPWVSAVISYMFRVKNMATNAVQIITRPVNSIALSNYAGITFGTPYQIDVSTNGGVSYGPTCVVNTPSPTSTLDAQCGTILTSMTQFVNCTYYANISSYRFRVTNTATNAVQIIDSGLNRFSFSQVGLPMRTFATTYFVEVALKNTDGSYLPYSAGCRVTTAPFPTTRIRPIQCSESGYQATSTAENFQAVIVAGASEYRFNLFNTGIGYSSSLDRSINTFNLNLFSGLLPGTTYSVRVALKIDGNWGPFGVTCKIITPGLSKTVQTISNEFIAIAYPNPFANDFMINVKTASESSIQIKVYDMLGKQIDNKNVEVSDIENLQLGANYTSGIYNVIVSQSENTQTLRVIKR